MEWRAQGILLSARRHGESAAIIEVFTEAHGRHAGVVRGGGGRKMAPILQPGASLDVTWRARLESQMGNFSVEPLRDRASGLLGDRAALAGIAAITGIVGFVLPERQAYPELYHQTLYVLDMVGGPEIWPYAYLRWELALLSAMGFGLDLSQCAVTGTSDDLVYVSPKTGRAVSAEGAGQWADRLLPLPPCLRGQAPTDPSDILSGLRTTGYFMEHHLARSLGDRAFPPARSRLILALERALPS